MFAPSCRTPSTRSRRRPRARRTRSTDSPKTVESNRSRLMTKLGVADVPALVAVAHARGILVMSYQPRLRLVTHLDIDAEHIARVVAAFRDFFTGCWMQ